MTLKICLLLASTASLLLGCASQTPPPPQLQVGQQREAIEHLRGFINREMQMNQIQGLSIAIVSDQTVVWEQGFGWANRAKNIPANAQTLYRAGSISKLLTDWGALKLVASGKLNLDEPIRQVIPDFAPAAPDGMVHPITPRMLMTHHSGLPRDVLKGYMSSKPEPFTEVIKHLNAMGADDVPMRSFSYSNAGISVLGAVVEKTSGQRFETWMNESVLQPLNMRESCFEATPSEQDKMAQGYKNGQPAKEPGLRDVPAAGLTSSVHDLANFMRMVFAEGRVQDKQLLPTTLMRSMLLQQNTHTPLDAGFRVGLGWMLGSLSADIPRGLGPVAHHSGGTKLFHSQMYVLPDQKVGVIVMANDQSAHALVDRVALRALNTQLQVQLAYRHEPTKAPIWATNQQENASPDRANGASTWPGLYSTLAGPVRITQGRSASPEAAVFGKSFTLRLRENGARSPVWSLMGLIPVELDDLSQLALTRQDIQGVQAITASLGGQTMLVGSRVPDTPVPEAWRQRVGAYRLTNQGDDSIAIADLQIRLNGQHLVLSYVDLDAGGEPQEMILRPISDASAQVLQLLPDAGPRLHVINVAGKERLSFSGFTAERL